MKVTYTTGPLSVTIEGDSQTDIFEQLASFQEVFNLNHTIKGKNVDSSDVRFAVRSDDDDNKYYEIRYIGNDKDLRGYKLSFGLHKKGGTMFVRRIKEEDKANYESQWDGWAKYIGPKKSNNASQNTQSSGGNNAPF